MKYCYPKKTYLVRLKKFTWRNFLRTGSLGRARYAARKLPVKLRQIDVYDRSKTYIIQPRVLE